MAVLVSRTIARVVRSARRSVFGLLSFAVVCGAFGQSLVPEGSTVTALSSRTEDLNGEGLPDLVIDFGEARDFDDAGTLDDLSVEVEFSAFTTNGDLVVGWDTVLITGN